MARHRYPSYIRPYSNKWGNHDIKPWTSPLGKSDHCVLNFDFNCNVNICTQPKTVKMRNNENDRDFNQEIKTIKWQDIQYLMRLIT
jgi:hypothetical protein